MLGLIIFLIVLTLIEWVVQIWVFAYYKNLRNKLRANKLDSYDEVLVKNITWPDNKELAKKLMIPWGIVLHFVEFLHKSVTED